MASGTIRLDHQFLVEIGLGHLESRQQKIILDRFYEVLRLRVGQALSSSLTKNEFATFERLVDEANEEAAQSYLQRVVPDYGVVVRSELNFMANAVFQSIRRGSAIVTAEDSQEESNG